MSIYWVLIGLGAVIIGTAAAVRLVSINTPDEHEDANKPL